MEVFPYKKHAETTDCALSVRLRQPPKKSEPSTESSDLSGHPHPLRGMKHPLCGMQMPLLSTITVL